MTKIESAKFVAIANRVGLQVIEQPSQYKIVGTDDRRFYVPGTKLVRKVELSGWRHELAVEWGRVYPGKAPPSKRIYSVVNFDQDERLVLRDFYRMALSIAPAREEPLPEELPEEPQAAAQ